MEPQQNMFVKILSVVAGITAVTAVVVASSIAGMNAYLAFGPAALEAQAIDVSAQNAPVTSATPSAACQKEIATAAARGYPDTESIVTDQTSLQFEDQCVAAVLNPGVTTLGPNNPGSYMCVGKSAKVNVGVAGLITETAFPDTAVPAGTCTVVACGAPDASGQSDCFAADNLTSLTGSSVEQNLAAAQASEITPDSGITSFTLNADGSVAQESANTADVLDSSVDDQGLAGNSVSLDGEAQDAAVPEQATDAAQDVPSIGETQAVSGSPTQLPEIEVTPSETPVTGDADIDAAAPESVPDATDVTAPPEISASTETSVPTQLPGAGLSGPQPTVPTITDTEGQVGSLQNVDSVTAESAPPSQNVLEQFAGAVQTDAVDAFNDVRGLLGLSPIDQNVPVTNPDSIGIRG